MGFPAIIQREKKRKIGSRGVEIMIVSHHFHDFLQRLVLIPVQIRNGLFVRLPLIGGGPLLLWHSGQHDVLLAVVGDDTLHVVIL